jgi:hypothetical protein
VLTSRSQKLALAALGSLMLVLLSVGTAGAADRYVSPGGSGSACTQLAPCPITTGINAAGSGDQVIIGPGTYGSQAAPIPGIQATQWYLTIRGESPFARPTIYATNLAGVTAFDPGQFAELSDLNIVSVSTTNTYYGIRATRGSVNRVTASGAAQDAICLILADASNTSCSASSPGTNAIESIIGGGETGPISVWAFNWVNITGNSTGSNGLLVVSNSGTDVDLAIANSIFNGSTNDISIWSNHTNSADADLDIWSSNFDDVDLHGVDVSVTSSAVANNQVAEPHFVNPAIGDVRPLATSPTVDAGDDTSVVGSYDAAGSARVFGARVDIGAYEWSPTPVVPIVPIIPDDPIVTKFKFAKKKFRAAKKGASIQPAKNAKRKSNKGFGSSFSFASTENGSVRFTLYKWSKKGSESKFRLLPGVISQKLVRGDRKFYFNGRWRGKKLATGKYQLRASPVRAGTSTLPEVQYWPTVPGPSFTIKK